MEYTDGTLHVWKNGTFIIPDGEEGVIILSEMEKSTTIVCQQFTTTALKRFELYWEKRAENHWPVSNVLLKGINAAT